jgi:hypothetical protein
MFSCALTPQCFASDSSAWGGSPHEFSTQITCWSPSPFYVYFQQLKMSNPGIWLAQSEGSIHSELYVDVLIKNRNCQHTHLIISTPPTLNYNQPNKSEACSCYPQIMLQQDTYSLASNSILCTHCISFYVLIMLTRQVQVLESRILCWQKHDSHLLPHMCQCSLA